MFRPRRARHRYEPLQRTGRQTMILSGLLSAIRALPEYPGLLEHLSGSGAGQNSAALRLQRSARVPVGPAPAPDLPPAIVVVSARALMWRTLPKRDFLANTRAIKVGQALRVEKALES